jgi:hypothetical protein
MKRQVEAAPPGFEALQVEDAAEPPAKKRQRPWESKENEIKFEMWLEAEKARHLAEEPDWFDPHYHYQQAEQAQQAQQEEQAQAAGPARRALFLKYSNIHAKDLAMIYDAVANLAVPLEGL